MARVCPAIVGTLFFVLCAFSQETAASLFAEAEKLRADPKTRKDSLALYAKSAALARDLKLFESEAKARLRLGQLLDITGERGGALAEFEAGLTPAKAAKDRGTEAGLHYGIAKVRYALADIPASIDSYRTALALRQQSGERFEEALILHNLGAAYWSIGKNREALAAYEEAIAIRRAIQDQPGIAYTLYGLASTHWTWGDAAKALDAYRQALQLWRSLKNVRGEADCLSSAGLMYASLGDTRQAVEHYRQSLALWKKLNDPVGEAYTLNNLGMAEGADGGPTFERAIGALRAAGDRRGQAYALHNLAGLEKPGSPEAIAHYEQSLALKREIGDRWGEVETLIRLADSLSRAGEAERALGLSREGLAFARQIGNRLAEANALSVEAAALCRLGRHEEASVSLLAALPRIEHLRAGLLSPDLRATFFATQQNLYLDTIDALMQLGQERKAFEISERRRSRVLLDRVFAAAPAANPIEREINVLNQQLQRMAGAPLGEGAKAVRRQLDAAFESWTAIEEKRIAAAGLDRWTGSPLERLQASILDDKTALLEYSVGETQGWLWIVTRKDIHAVKLPPRAKLEALTLRHATALAARRVDAAADRDLYRALIAVAGPMTGIERLIFALDAPLNHLNVGAIGDLLQRFELVEIPSAATLVALRERPRVNKPSLTIFADPVFDRSDARLNAEEASAVTASDAPLFPRLHFSRIEAEAILKLAPPSSSQLLQGFDAAKGRIDTPAVRATRILHLATHATVDESRPEKSVVLLSQFDAQGKPRNGALGLNEIYALHLNADLVVLSSCRGASGAGVGGEGALSLARAFLYAGAGSVIASEWEMQDRAAAELMKRFYEGIFRNKLSAAAALRRAQIAMRSTAQWAHPYFWAGFRLRGDWR